jgi:hypothetical protein
MVLRTLPQRSGSQVAWKGSVTSSLETPVLGVDPLVDPPEAVAPKVFRRLAEECEYE